MKKLLTSILALFLAINAFCQIKGNGIMAQKTVELPGLQSIDIQFNAKVILDFQSTDAMVINAQSNIIDLIGVNFMNGQLTLDQIKWIEPSQEPVITIGCADVNSVFQGTHSTTYLENLDADKLTLAGNVGKIVAEGNVDQLVLDVGRTDCDLRALRINKLIVNSMCKSRLIVNQFDEISIDDDAEALIKYLDESKTPKEVLAAKQESVEKPSPFVKFKIKNNSIRRHAFYVKGPNNRGGKFSYGFSMLPLAKRNENWTVGTKVFKVSRAGDRELLYTVALDDKGQTVDLF